MTLYWQQRRFSEVYYVKILTQYDNMAVFERQQKQPLLSTVVSRPHRMGTKMKFSALYRIEQGLLIQNTFNPPLFSLDNTFTLRGLSHEKHRIKIFWHKWLLLGLIRNLHWLFNFKNEPLLRVQLSLLQFSTRWRWKHMGEIILEMSSRLQFNTLQYHFKMVSPTFQEISMTKKTIFEVSEQILQFLRGPKIVFQQFWMNWS